MMTAVARVEPPHGLRDAVHTWVGICLLGNPNAALIRLSFNIMFDPCERDMARDMVAETLRGVGAPAGALDALIEGRIA